MSSSDRLNLHVIIVGAGLGGLTLAQCLRRQGISFEIFERDQSPKSRDQGWSISLHTMLKELKKSLPSDLPGLEGFPNHLLPLKLNPQICLYNEDDPRVGVEATPQSEIIRVNRMRLRDVLSLHVPVQWNKRLLAIEEEGETVKIQLTGGTTARGHILVGADGVNSIVREHLLGMPNQDTLHVVPTAVITGETVLTNEAMERMLELGHSCYVARTGDYWLFAGLHQALSDGKSGNYYWFLMWSDDTVADNDHWLRTASQAEKLAFAKVETARMASKLREIIELTPEQGIQDATFIYRDAEIEELPVGRITVVGDAAHPMTSFRGEGGVHAIRDVLALSKTLAQVDVNDPSTIPKALASYQAEMLPRGIDAVRKSRDALRNNATEGAEIIVWGHKAEAIPEERILLADIH